MREICTGCCCKAAIESENKPTAALLTTRSRRGSRRVQDFFLFFRRDALKEQFGKEPSTVRCLAVKSALLGTRHPRKEKEAALQNVTGEPACLYCRILMTTQSEMEPSIKIEELKSVAHNRRGRNPESGGVAIRNPGLARPVAGCPHQKGSGLSTLPRTTYQTYLRGGGVHTYIPKHTYLDY